VRERLAVGALGAAAVGLWAAAPTYPNYDAYYDLVWGRQLLHGHAPSFEAYQAPTQHPLYVALGALLSAVFGGHADRALVLVAALAHVALTWAVYRVGRACFGTAAGVLAALFVVSSFALLLYAARAYVDLPFLAVVLWAAAIEAQAPGRRPRLVMALLTVAGLLRPEAWLLAGLYWLWRGWRRVDLLAIAAIAPVVWAGVDAAVTGDPLHSIHATSDLADELHRSRGVRAVPGAFFSFVFDVARPPVAAAGAVGLALALRFRERVRALHVPLALLGAGAATFLATGVAGLSILQRYLTVPVVAVCLFAGYAVAWLGRSRAVTVAMVAVAVAFLAIKASSFGKLAGELRFIHRTHSDLVAVLHDPAVARARRCGPVTLPNYRLVPDTKWILGNRAPVGARSAKRRPAGVALFVNGVKALERFGFADAASPLTDAPDPGYVIVARHRTFTAYARCPAPRGGPTAAR
jgi:hypothetical protein